MAGFVNVRLEEEKPIFNKQRIDFTPPEKINHLSVCNNQLCMSLGKDTLLRQITLLLSLFGLLWLAPIGCCVAHTHVCWIYRIDLAKPDQPNQIELGRKDESKVHRLFLDPTGEETHDVYSASIDRLIKNTAILLNQRTEWTAAEFVLLCHFVGLFCDVIFLWLAFWSV